ncbi:hypothetical protein BDN70DRAFT_936329 [Pholiota conissans]|uniref:Uncharacterized protein n=1 Tax=Pholiota conissans TaxID=109636 RepID=A0A9P5YS44_9AGAR|nr:hypothetical protein BDN70DRAFT_936329 [Pholiota conissans]
MRQTSPLRKYWSKQVPMAIENFSPKKDSSTRIHRPGLDDPQNTVNLGSIGAFLSGMKPRNLNFPLVDEYKLRIEDKGLLVCDLLLYDVDSSNNSSSSVKPLDLARLRKDLKVGLKSPRKKSAFIDKGSEFIEFLRTLLDVQPRAPRAETVGHLLECYLALEAGYSKLTNMQWGRTEGGYRVPSEFTKVHVQQAFDIQPTLASNDAALFDPGKLINCPDIRAWIANPDGPHKDTFARMSKKTFREYITKQDERAKIRHHDVDAHALRKAERKEEKRRRKEQERDDCERASKCKRNAGFESVCEYYVQ